MEILALFKKIKKDNYYSFMVRVDLRKTLEQEFWITKLFSSTSE